MSPLNDGNLFEDEFLARFEKDAEIMHQLTKKCITAVLNGDKETAKEAALEARGMANDWYRPPPLQYEHPEQLNPNDVATYFEDSARHLEKTFNRTFP